MSSAQLVVGGILVDPAGRVMAARRNRPEALRGRWEFPGGKVEPGEDPRHALVRELREELGVTVQVHAELENSRSATDDALCHDGTWPIDERFVLRVWFCALVAGDPAPGESHDQVCWSARDQLLQLDWVPADRPIARALAAR